MTDTIEDLIKYLRSDAGDPNSFGHLNVEAATAIEEQAAEIKRLKYIVTNMLAGESKLRAGYAVVPVEPTEAMVLVTQHSSVGKSPVLSERMTKEIYKAMLEAAKETGE